MKRVLAWWLICGWLAVTPKVFAASQIDSVTIGYSSFAGAYGPLWIAVEEQLGRKHGLELKKAGIVFKTNKQKSLTVLKNYMRGAADDILDDTYESTKAGTATVPTPVFRNHQDRGGNSLVSISSSKANRSSRDPQSILRQKD
jgi:hypothetical protein